MSNDNNKPDGKDWNDLASVAGLDEVQRQLLSGVSVADRPSNITSKEPKAFEGVESTSRDEGREDFEPPEDWELPACLDTTKNGVVMANLLNLIKVLTLDKRWRGVLGYNEFSCRIEKRVLPPMRHSEVGPWEESDAASLRAWVAQYYGFTPNHQDINDALMHIAPGNKYHPVREWLESLEWDGEERLHRWLIEAFKPQEPEKYIGAVGARFLIGAVARIFEPGCKFDNVLILEGKQGIGKSSVISVLFGEWFTDAPLPIGDKEQYGLMYGKWGYELAELSSFSKKEEETLKQFFSQVTDRFRPPYGRMAIDHKRQTVFLGTTNDHQYMKDPTGNRRYWPVGCLCALVDWVAQMREQLWAEAVHRYRQGERRYIPQDDPDPSEAELCQMVIEIQDMRAIGDTWADKLYGWLAGRDGKEFSLAEIMEDGLEVLPGVQTPPLQKRAAAVLVQLGWERKRTAKGRLWRKIPVQPDLTDGGPIL